MNKFLDWFTRGRQRYFWRVLVYLNLLFFCVETWAAVWFADAGYLGFAFMSMGCALVAGAMVTRLD